jgi:2'-5' RNA ligase
MSPTQPFILTLKFDATTFERLDGLRRQYFPPERNFIPAHATLFHALPAKQEEFIRQTLTEVCNATPILPLHFPKLRFLGKGTAIEIECDALLNVRQQLANAWREFLTAQDSQKFKPHVTIQNKAAPDSARQLFNKLSATFLPFNATAEGLLLWRYLGGRWRFVDEFMFGRK